MTDTELKQEFAVRPLELSATLPLAPETAPLAIAEPQPKSKLGLRTLFSHWFSKETIARLRKLAPWLISGSILGLNLVIHAPAFLVGALIAGLTVRVLKAVLYSSPVAKKAWK